MNRRRFMSLAGLTAVGVSRKPLFKHGLSYWEDLSVDEAESTSFTVNEDLMFSMGKTKPDFVELSVWTPSTGIGVFRYFPRSNTFVEPAGERERVQLSQGVRYVFNFDDPPSDEPFCYVFYTKKDAVLMYLCETGIFNTAVSDLINSLAVRERRWSLPDNNNGGIVFSHQRLEADDVTAVIPVSQISYLHSRGKERNMVTAHEESIVSPFSGLLAYILSRDVYGKTLSRLKKSQAPLEKGFENVLRYVWGFRYVDDKEKGYQQLPEETVVRGAGDCEDFAVLMNGILSRPPFGFDTGIGFSQNHVFTLVDYSQLKKKINLDAVSYNNSKETVQIDGREYLAIDSTSTRLGSIPEKPVWGVYIENEWRKVSPTSFARSLTSLERNDLVDSVSSG